MLVLVFVALGIMAVPLYRGDLSRLARVRVRGWPLLSAALALQVLVMKVWPDGPDRLLRALHIASYVAAFTVIWLNRRLPWLWCLGVGAALNLLVIAANGGVMSASASALRAAGRDTAEDGFVNSTVVPAPRLEFLGDVFAVPRWVPFANVFSIGDICIAVGAVLVVHGICRKNAAGDLEKVTVVTSGS